MTYHPCPIEPDEYMKCPECHGAGEIECDGEVDACPECDGDWMTA